MEQSPNDVGVLCRRAMNSSEWSEKAEFMQVFYWGRQMFALIFGILYGSVPLKGTFALVLFVCINIGIVYIYAVKHQNKTDKSYVQTWALMKTGFVTSSFGFTIIWLIFFRTLHADFFIASYTGAK